MSALPLTSKINPASFTTGVMYPHLVMFSLCRNIAKRSHQASLGFILVFADKHYAFCMQHQPRGRLLKVSRNGSITTTVMCHAGEERSHSIHLIILKHRTIRRSVQGLRFRNSSFEGRLRYTHVCLELTLVVFKFLTRKMMTYMIEERSMFLPAV